MTRRLTNVNKSTFTKRTTREKPKAGGEGACARGWVGILAAGAAWAPCCYPATLQAGHAFSGLRGSAAAPFAALHHPVREHPAPR